jgi:MerR family mercuric resistance operon transcriptional regulator
MDNMTIGRAAAAAGVNVETIRFYERRGLITRPRRPQRGFRSYDGATVERVRFIREAQALGFTLAQVKLLAQMRTRLGDGCGEAASMAEAKLAEFDAKITRLKAMRQALAHEVERCRKSGGKSCKLHGGTCS